MKVLFWAELFWPYIGGVEVFGMQLLPALKGRGYECAVMTSRGERRLPEEDHYEGIPIYRFPFQSALLRYDLRAVATICQRVAAFKRHFKPDVIHINTLAPSLFFHLQTLKTAPAPSLVTVHSPIGRLDKEGMLKKLFRTAGWIAAVSEAMLSDLKRPMPEVVGRSSVVYSGLPMPVVEPGPLPFDEPRIVCLGRITEEKGFDVVLEAFHKIIDRFPRARLILAGDGPEKPNLEEQVRKLKVEHAVDFTGWVHPEQVPELINSATMVVMPSRWREPFGLVAVQAAQMARPIVASRVGGLPEIVVHGQTGLLAEKDDSTAVAEGIAFLLEHPEEAVRMGQAARKRAQDLFDMDRFVGDYDLLYRKLSSAATCDRRPST